MSSSIVNSEESAEAAELRAQPPEVSVVSSWEGAPCEAASAARSRKYMGRAQGAPGFAFRVYPQARALWPWYVTELP